MIYSHKRLCSKYRNYNLNIFSLISWMEIATLYWRPTKRRAAWRRGTHPCWRGPRPRIYTNICRTRANTRAVYLAFMVFCSLYNFLSYVLQIPKICLFYFYSLYIFRYVHKKNNSKQYLFSPVFQPYYLFMIFNKYVLV